jgi:hypothetical protein
MIASLWMAAWPGNERSSMPRTYQMNSRGQAPTGWRTSATVVRPGCHSPYSHELKPRLQEQLPFGVQPQVITS